MNQQSNIHIFPYRLNRTYVPVQMLTTVSLSFVCCISLRINHSHYLQCNCILAFVHSCRMSLLIKNNDDDKDDDDDDE